MWFPHISSYFRDFCTVNVEISSCGIAYVFFNIIFSTILKERQPMFCYWQNSTYYMRIVRLNIWVTRKHARKWFLHHCNPLCPHRDGRAHCRCGSHPHPRGLQNLHRPHRNPRPRIAHPTRSRPARCHPLRLHPLPCWRRNQCLDSSSHHPTCCLHCKFVILICGSPIPAPLVFILPAVTSCVITLTAAGVATDA